MCKTVILFNCTVAFREDVTVVENSVPCVLSRGHLYFLYLGKSEMAAFQIAVHLITDICQCLTFLFTSLADCGVKEQ